MSSFRASPPPSVHGCLKSTPPLCCPHHATRRPQQGGSLVAYAKLWAIPPWGAWRGGLATPPGASDNGVGVDFNGAGRGGASNTVGAFVVPVPQG